MKLILELDSTDIDSTFKEAYDLDYIPIYELERYHFNDTAQEYWFSANEIWFIQRAVIQQSETESFELTPHRSKLK